MIRGLVITALAMSLCARHAAASDEQNTREFNLQKAAEVPFHRSLMRRIDKEPDSLNDFTTDGCSGGMSAGWSLIVEEFPDLAKVEDKTLPWASCCVTHDQAYHNAGATTDAEESYEARLAADDALMSCVIKTGEAQKSQTMERLGLSANQATLAYRVLARSMYNAVRLGGGPCSRLPWRWGYGYPHC